MLCRCVMSQVQEFAFHELLVSVSSFLLFPMACPDSLPYPVSSFPHYLALVCELGWTAFHPINQVIHILNIIGLGIGP